MIRKLLEQRAVHLRTPSESYYRNSDGNEGGSGMTPRNAEGVERSLAGSGRNGEPGTASTEGRIRRSRRAGRPVAVLATVAIVGTACFVALIVALHFLSPEFDPIERPTSEYAQGPFGYLMTAAFVSLSLSTWALVIGLRRDLSGPAQSRLGLVFLGVWGIGLLVAATFPIDLDGAPQTLAGTIHRINGPLTFLSLIIGTNLVSRGFKQDVRWRPIHRFASVLALIMIVEFVAGGMAVATETGAGIAQRILVITLATWFVLTAVRLRVNATETAAKS
jgi:hypothetical protein